MNLSEYFLGIGYKRLSTVEIDAARSNQHELNGISKFKEIFGSQKVSFSARFLFFSDEEDSFLEEQGNSTWYDARENHPARSEFRLYYSNSGIFQKAKESDLLIVLQKNREEVWFIIVPKDSTSERQLIWLFGLEDLDETGKIGVKTEISDKEQAFAKKYILEKLGIEIPVPEEDFLEVMLKRFDGLFPTTSIFSGFARSTLSLIPALENPDKALIASFDREEYLFKIFEKHLVKQRMRNGFGEDGLDVDQFISFSLSVHNRRKSRAGYSLENHLEYIFQENEILFSRGAITERRSKPDFLFPGIEYYKDSAFEEKYLKMLGSKTSAKDRWRQVLPEADRIKNKHLITLEPSISLTQTNEMKEHNVTLVVPEVIRSTYTETQQSEILTLSDFIEFVKETEALAGF